MFGPTALLVVARAMGWLEGRDGAVCVEAEKLAAVLGVGVGPLWRAVVRLQGMRLATVTTSGTVTSVVIGRWRGPTARAREIAAACQPEVVNA